MLKRITLKLILLGMFSATAQAAQVNLSINNDAAAFQLSSHISPNAIVSGGYHYDTDDGQIANIGLKATHRNGIHNFNVGGKFLFSWPDNRSATQALALGGDYTMNIAPKLFLNGFGHYAPNVLSSSNLSSYYDYGVSVGFRIIPNASVSLGYKNIYYDYKDQRNTSFDQGMFFAANFGF